MRKIIKLSLLISLIIALPLTFIGDLTLLPFAMPSTGTTNMTMAEWKNLDTMLFKDAMKYIDDHTEKRSYLENIKLILSNYLHPGAWIIKLRTFLLYFVGILAGCLLMGKKLIEPSN